MRLIGNIIWVIICGIVPALIWLLLGLLWCITIIGIPFGLQAFKLARLSAWPFGSKIDSNFGAHPFVNIIWIIFGGLELAIGYLLLGLILCITIIGIPFGKQCFKLMTIAIAPFGAKIR